MPSVFFATRVPERRLIAFLIMSLLFLGGSHSAAEPSPEPKPAPQTSEKVESANGGSSTDEVNGTSQKESKKESKTESEARDTLLGVKVNPGEGDPIQRLTERIEQLESELVEIREDKKSKGSEKDDEDPDKKESKPESEMKPESEKKPVPVEDPLLDTKAKSDVGKRPVDDKKPDTSWLDLSTEKWNVKLGGHVQADLIEWANRDPNITSPLARDYFEFRRLRLVADGTGYGVYDFRLQLTLEPETVNDAFGTTFPAVKDAYFSINETPLGRFRIGNFFVPFSLEQVTNDTNTVFLERSIPTQGVFSADREPGIALYNCTEDQRMTWTTGIFIDSISDAIQERIDSNMGYRISGRVTWLPYYDEPSKGRYLVHTGAGVLHTNDFDDRTRFRTRPQIHEGPFLLDTGVFDSPSYTTGNLEFATVLGPFCLQSEAFLCNVQRGDVDPAMLYGSYVYGTYCLTGENRNYERFGQHGAQFARFVPFNHVYWVPGAWSLGAWEIKARWSWLGLNEVDAGQYNDFTIGFNWYWSDRVRILFDWIHPITSSEAVYGNTQSDIIAMRFDFNW
ncbi:MAG: porin [Planctomycetota bacterium]